MSTSRSFERFDVLLARFPFSDLDGGKTRPVLVLAVPGGDDVIASKITSRHRASNPHEYPLRAKTIPGAHLDDSYVHLDSIVTLHTSLIHKKIGHLETHQRTVIENGLKRLLGLPP